MENSQTKNMLVVAAILIIGIMAWSLLSMADQRSGGQKIGNAVDVSPQGVDTAARQFESRTPDEEPGDAVKDAGDDIKENTAN